MNKLELINRINDNKKASSELYESMIKIGIQTKQLKEDLIDIYVEEFDYVALASMQESFSELNRLIGKMSYGTMNVSTWLNEEYVFWVEAVDLALLGKDKMGEVKALVDLLLDATKNKSVGLTLTDRDFDVVRLKFRKTQDTQDLYCVEYQTQSRYYADFDKMIFETVLLTK